MPQRELSAATIKRIPLYFRAVKALQEQGVKRVRSHYLEDLVKVPSATIRRDFSSFGDLGRSGYGYAVDHLVQVFGEILDVHSTEKIIIVGCGNLGQALIQNNFRRNPDLAIVAGFDQDPALVGETVGDVVIHALEDLPQICAGEIHTAIVCVPSAAQASVIPFLEQHGITAILTFAPLLVDANAKTTIRYIDLTSEMQSLVFVDHQNRQASLTDKD